VNCLYAAILPLHEIYNHGHLLIVSLICHVQDVARERDVNALHPHSSSKRQKVANCTSFSQLLCAAEQSSSNDTAAAAAGQRSLFEPYCSSMSERLHHQKLSALAAAAAAASCGDATISNDVSNHVSAHVSALSLFAPAIATHARAAAFATDSSDSGNSSSSSSSSTCSNSWSPVPSAEQQPLWQQLPASSGCGGDSYSNYSYSNGSSSNGSNDSGSNGAPPARRGRPKGSGAKSRNSSSSNEAVKKEALRSRKRVCSKKIRELNAERVRDCEYEVASLEG
jgi:hypothetical protein